MDTEDTNPAIQYLTKCEISSQSLCLFQVYGVKWCPENVFTWPILLTQVSAHPLIPRDPIVSKPECECVPELNKTCCLLQQHWPFISFSHFYLQHKSPVSAGYYMGLSPCKARVCVCVCVCFLCLCYDGLRKQTVAVETSTENEGWNRRRGRHCWCLCSYCSNMFFFPPSLSSCSDLILVVRNDLHASAALLLTPFIHRFTAISSFHTLLGILLTCKVLRMLRLVLLLTVFIGVIPHSWGRMSNIGLPGIIRYHSISVGWLPLNATPASKHETHCVTLAPSTCPHSVTKVWSQGGIFTFNTTCWADTFVCVKFWFSERWTEKVEEK